MFYWFYKQLYFTIFICTCIFSHYSGWRCKTYGHRTGDRECPLFVSGNAEIEKFRYVSFSKIQVIPQSTIASPTKILGTIVNYNLITLLKLQCRSYFRKCLKYHEKILILILLFHIINSKRRKQIFKFYHSIQHEIFLKQYLCMAMYLKF